MVTAVENENSMEKILKMLKESEKVYLVSYDLPVRWIIWSGTITHTYLSRAIKREFWRSVKDSFIRVGNIKNLFITDKMGLQNAISCLSDLSDGPIEYTKFLQKHFTRFKIAKLEKEWKKLTSDGKYMITLDAKLFYLDITEKNYNVMTFEIAVELPDSVEFSEFIEELKIKGKVI